MSYVFEEEDESDYDNSKTQELNDEVDLFDLKEKDLENLNSDLKSIENKNIEENFDYDDAEMNDQADDGEESDESDEVNSEVSSSDNESLDDNAKRKKRNRLYEEDIEEEKYILERRKKYSKSVVDDNFFCLAEMNEFLDAQDKLEEKIKLGSFDGAEKLAGVIEKFEEENLQPRSWELQGEVTAKDRYKDELLTQFIDADFRAINVPEITSETTEHLESIIIKRIKDKMFDDVIRKVRQHESLILQYRNKTSFEDSIRKGLAEVYEKEFQDKQIETTNEPELDATVAEVEKDMLILFKKLDALSHYQFTPSILKPEVKVVKNVASLRVEEVGPMASVEQNSMLLAPEEVLKHSKDAPKSKDELTITDKKRFRRKKKLKQKFMFSIKKKSDSDQPAERAVKVLKKLKS